MNLKPYRNNLFVRGHTKDLPLAVKDGILRGAFTLVLNVSPEADAELATAAAQGPFSYRYVHVALSDGMSVSPLVPALAELVADEMAAGGTVLVHCRAGRNRSALVAMLAIACVEQLHPLAVLAEIRAQYPTVLANPAFEDYLGTVRGPWGVTPPGTDGKA